VTLRHPNAGEFDAYKAAEYRSYVDQIVASGSMTREAAEEKARREDAELLPDGLATTGQLIFRVEADGQPAGWLWMALQGPRAEAGVGYIYDVTVDEALRGRGYGRAAMQLAEESESEGAALKFTVGHRPPARCRVSGPSTGRARSADQVPGYGVAPRP
jgi:ribosomal protein S18 acetylase RimI-like enzyme